METAIEKNKHSIDEAVESKNFLEAKKQFIAWGCIKNNLSDCYRSSIGAIIGDGSDKSLVKREDAILSELLPTLKERDIPYADLIYLLENSISKKFASYIPQWFNAYDRNMKQVVIWTWEPVIVAKHIQEPISNENKYEILPEQEEETMKAIELAVRWGLIGKTEDVDIPYFTSYNNVRVRVFQDNEYGLDVMDIYRFILRGIKLGVIKIHQEERLPIPKDQRPENIAEVQEYFRKILFPVKQEIS